MEPDPILAVGATGTCAEQLIALLDAAGYCYEAKPQEALDTITPAIMAAAVDAQGELAVKEPAEFALPGVSPPRFVKGTFIGQDTWTALRKAAAERTGLLNPAAAPAATAPDPTAVASSTGASTEPSPGDAGTEGKATGEGQKPSGPVPWR